jgi:hypothetical protein
MAYTAADCRLRPPRIRGTAAIRLLLAVAGLTLCGASCPARISPFNTPLAPVLPPQPTLAQVIEVVNRNNSQISSFATDEAVLSGPDFPTLRRTSVAFERPRSFRLKAGTNLLGDEIDVGSNSDLFWMWIRRNQPPALFYCRHEQFASSPVRQSIPIDPDWLIEALGVVDLDPARPHEGPLVLPGDRVEIRTLRQTPTGPMTKSTIVDLRHGWVVEQHLFDAQGQRVASAAAREHRRDPLSNLTMPKIVDLYSPRMNFQMRIDLGNVKINSPMMADRAELFAMPSYPNYPPVDLCDPNLQVVPNQPVDTTAWRGSPPR